MASDSRKMIFIALILTIAVPISSNQIETSRRLEYLCSETKKSNECMKILKSESNRVDESDKRTLAMGVTDLAIEKSKEIFDRVFRFYSDPENERLKMKYLSCAKNYYNANCNLVLAQRNLDFDEYPDISDEIDDAEEESKICRRELGEGSLDRSWDGELELYLDMVRAAAGRFPKDDGGEPQLLLF